MPLAIELNLFRRLIGMEAQPQHEPEVSKAHEDAHRHADMDSANPQSSHAPHDAGQEFIDRPAAAKEDPHPDPGDSSLSPIATLANAFVLNVKVRQILRAFFINHVNEVKLRSCIIPLRRRKHIALPYSNIAQLRFGEQSSETIIIYGTLGKFKRGELPKREALTIVSDTLGSHHDLKYDLMEILNHKDSQWGPGDFDLPVLSNPQSAPQFLQPAHQPQMRLPSMSALWESNKNALSTVNPEVLSSSDRYESIEQSNIQEASFSQTGLESWQAPSRAMLSSPHSSTPSRSLVPVQLTSPGVGHIGAHLPFSSPNRDESLDPPGYGLCIIPQQPRYKEPWGRNDYSNAWIDDGPGHFFEHEEFHASNQYLPAVSYEARSPESAHLHNRSESATIYNPHQEHSVARASSPQDGASEPSMLGNPFAVPIGQPAIDMPPPPPPRKRNRKLSVAQMKAENQHDAYDGRQVPEYNRDEVSQADTKTSRNQPDGNGLFIHSLCGKDFASRPKVKKHHWGTKMNDLNTTTGCWAKHNKPNISWDDHPSCKEQVQTSNTSVKIQQRSISANHKTPVVPSLGSSHGNIGPAFPTLQDLSQTVAEALNSPHAPTQHVQEGFLPYHTHQLSFRSPFDSLLTAVNVVSEIEAPTSQGRNDSVISPLDAHALAAERTGQYLPAWAFSSPQYDDNLDYGRHYQPPSVGYGQGFSMSPSAPTMSMNRAYPSRMGDNGYASSTVSPTKPTADFGGLSPTAGHIEENTANQNHHRYTQREWEPVRSSLSPGPERKKFRV